MPPEEGQATALERDAEFESIVQYLEALPDAVFEEVYRHFKGL